MKRKTVFRKLIHCIRWCTKQCFVSKPMFYLFALFLLSSLKLFTVGGKGTRGFKSTKIPQSKNENIISLGNNCFEITQDIGKEYIVVIRPFK